MGAKVNVCEGESLGLRLPLIRYSVLRIYMYIHYSLILCSQGFVFHTLSTASEWGTSFTLLLFFLTFHSDFKEIRLDVTVQRRSEVAMNESIINESTPLTI